MRPVVHIWLQRTGLLQQGLGYLCLCKSDTSPIQVSSAQVPCIRLSGECTAGEALGWGTYLCRPVTWEGWDTGEGNGPKEPSAARWWVCLPSSTARGLFHLGPIMKPTVRGHGVGRCPGAAAPVMGSLLVATGQPKGAAAGWPRHPVTLPCRPPCLLIWKWGRQTSCFQTFHSPRRKYFISSLVMSPHSKVKGEFGLLASKVPFCVQSLAPSFLLRMVNMWGCVKVEEEEGQGTGTHTH